MKRLLLSSMLVLAMGRTAFGYVNSGVVEVPPMDPSLIQIDDPIFVNDGLFSVNLSAQNLDNTVLYETSDTVNYTNNGVMEAVPGFDFETFPSSYGFAQPATTFVNKGNGLGGGSILCTNIYGGEDPFTFGDGLGPPGLATIRVRADTIEDSGLMSIDESGLIDLAGQNLDLTRSTFLVNGSGGFTNTTFGVNSIDYGVGLDTNGDWVPSAALTPTTATSSIFWTANNPLFQILQLTNSLPYFDNYPNGPPPFNAGGEPAPNDFVYRAIFLQDNSPSNVTHNVYFGGFFVGNGAAHIEWVGVTNNPVTGAVFTNYFYLSDVYILAAAGAGLGVVNGVPINYTFAESTNKLITGAAPQPPGMPAGIFGGFVNVTNTFSYLNADLIDTTVPTNVTVFGSLTNVPGRIQLQATASLNLNHTIMAGNNYLSLQATNDFIGNTGAVITVPFMDLNLRAPSGSLTISNLFVPRIPDWSGNIQAFTGIFTNFVGTGTTTITNEFRILLVASDVQPTTPAQQQDVFLHAPNILNICDDFTVLRTFNSDAAQVTLTTNGPGAFSQMGELNMLSPAIFWSSSLPNVQYLTNWGIITTANAANFAGNMTSPDSDPNAATPYQAFVNHGGVTNQGTFIRANYFLNSGGIAEQFQGNIDIGDAITAIATNGSFVAPNGYVTISANSLIASNGIIFSGNALTLNTPCSLSDGYVFGNQFAHATNSLLPNVVTNGNFWTTWGGLNVPAMPATADLLGTTITNIAFNNFSSPNVWPAQDRGLNPQGFGDNLAVGRMILNADTTSQFNFAPANGNNAIYVDSIELQGNTTNTDAHGNPLSIAIQPGMTIYYAQAIEDGASVAELLNGKFGAGNTNGGQFLWVSNYAGVYSSTNIPYPDHNTYIFNEALAISPDINSGGPDGSGITNGQKANLNNPFPIPTNVLYDITVTGPLPCDPSGGNGAGNPSTNSPGTTNGAILGKLSFPPEFPASTGGGGSNPPVSFSAAAGSYNGLFYQSDAVTPSSSGYFSATVTSKGGFTAKLQVGSKTYSFSGSFNTSAKPVIQSVSAKGLPTLSVELQLVDNDRISGTVSGSNWTSQLQADRAAFTSKNGTSSAGKDTLLLASDGGNSTANTGEGFGTANVSTSGGVQWSGTLPDGVKVSQKSALSENSVWPLYSSLYGGSGVLIGWMQCTNQIDITGSAVWEMPAGAGGLYPGGLTNQIDVTGSRVQGSFGFIGKGATVFAGAGLANPFTNNVIVGNTIQSLNSSLKLSVNPHTGLFSGSVIDPGNQQKLLFQGALLERSGIGGGFFLNADQSGKVYFGPAN